MTEDLKYPEEHRMDHIKRRLSQAGAEVAATDEDLDGLVIDVDEANLFWMKLGVWVIILWVALIFGSTIFGILKVCGII